MACAMRQLLYTTLASSNLQLSFPLPSPVSRAILFITSGISVVGKQQHNRFSRLAQFYGRRNPMSAVAKSSPQNDGIVAADDDDNDDGVSLGTLKLPLDTDLQRFETLLFQWANSLCQGANLPLPVPLKVDKIPGGARLGFITIGDGETEVLVYIDCLVFPPTDGSGPIFRAIRNGPSKDTPPPGEPRIMRSLLQALKTSVEIARV